MLEEFKSGHLSNIARWRLTNPATQDIAPIPKIKKSPIISFFGLVIERTIGLIGKTKSQMSVTMLTGAVTVSLSACLEGYKIECKYTVEKCSQVDTFAEDFMLQIP